MMIKLNGGADYLVYQFRKPDQIEIEDILVTTERGKGVGRELVAKLVAAHPEARRIFAFTRDTNEIAQQFYEKVGFVGVAAPNFYGDGNAVLYIKQV